MEISISEPVDLSGIESMAKAASAVFQDLPEELFYDDTLANNLLMPIKQEAELVLGRWAYVVTANSVIGCNTRGLPDYVLGENSISFFGRWADVDVHVLQGEPDPLTVGLDGALVPSLVFDTFDDEIFDKTLAQTYLRVAVPLLGTLVDIQRHNAVYTEN